VTGDGSDSGDRDGDGEGDGNGARTVWRGEGDDIDGGKPPHMFIPAPTLSPVEESHASELGLSSGVMGVLGVLEGGGVRGRGGGWKLADARWASKSSAGRAGRCGGEDGSGGRGLCSYMTAEGCGGSCSGDDGDGGCRVLSLLSSSDLALTSMLSEGLGNDVPTLRGAGVDASTISSAAVVMLGSCDDGQVAIDYDGDQDRGGGSHGPMRILVMSSKPGTAVSFVLF
jgi:hypothetical protein